MNILQPSQSNETDKKVETVVTEPIKVETNTSPAEPEPTNKVEPAKPESDLFKRVSEFQKKADPNDKTDAEIDADYFDDNQLRATIDKIEDPVLKDHYVKLRKSMITGRNEKFKELSALKKEVQEIKQGAQNPGFYDIEKQANDPQWRQLAQDYSNKVASGESSIDQDALTDNEKILMQDLKNTKDEVIKIKAQNQENIKLQNQAYRNQQHQTLETKFSDYDRKKIDEITFEMLDGKRQSVGGESLQSDVYWALNGPKAVERAYEMGRQDERESKGEIPPSISGITTRSSDSISSEEGESGKHFMSRLVTNTLSKIRTKTQV